MLLTLPDLRQKEEWACGRVMFELFCEYWKKPLPLFIANLSNAVSGLSPDSLEAGFRSLGFKVISGSWTVPLLRAVTREGKPVAALTQLDGVGHWVAVGGVQRGRVHFHCPVHGPTTQTIERWDRSWVDFHQLGGVFDRWAIVPYLED